MHLGGKTRSTSESDTGAFKVPVDRQFDFIQKLATLDAKLESYKEDFKTIKTQIDDLNIEDIHTVLTDFDIDTLTDKLDSLTLNESVSQVQTTMESGAKNTLKFGGKCNENVALFLQKIELLEKANGWTKEKYYAQILLSLQDSAMRYYNTAVQEDSQKFKTTSEDGKTTFDDPAKLRDFLSKTFKASDNFGDVLTRISNDTMRKGESVETYLNRIMPIIETVEMTDEIQRGVILNGLRSDISQTLRLRNDIKSVNDLVTWAKKVEQVYYKYKHDTPIVASLSNPRNAVGGARPRDVRCFTCGQLGHVQRNCNANKENFQSKTYVNSRKNNYYSNDRPSFRSRTPEPIFRSRTPESQFRPRTPERRQVTFDRGTTFNERGRGTFNGVNRTSSYGTRDMSLYTRNGNSQQNYDRYVPRTGMNQRFNEGTRVSRYDETYPSNTTNQRGNTPYRGAHSQTPNRGGNVSMRGKQLHNRFLSENGDARMYVPPRGNYDNRPANLLNSVSCAETYEMETDDAAFCDDDDYNDYDGEQDVEDADFELSEFKQGNE